MGKTILLLLLLASYHLHLAFAGTSMVSAHAIEKSDRLVTTEKLSVGGGGRGGGGSGSRGGGSSSGSGSSGRKSPGSDATKGGAGTIPLIVGGGAAAAGAGAATRNHHGGSPPSPMSGPAHGLGLVALGLVLWAFIGPTL